MKNSPSTPHPRHSGTCLWKLAVRDEGRSAFRISGSQRFRRNDRLGPQRIARKRTARSAGIGVGHPWHLSCARFLRNTALWRALIAQDVPGVFRTTLEEDIATPSRPGGTLLLTPPVALHRIADGGEDPERFFRIDSASGEARWPYLQSAQRGSIARLPISPKIMRRRKSKRSCKALLTRRMNTSCSQSRLGFGCCRAA